MKHMWTTVAIHDTWIHEKIMPKRMNRRKHEIRIQYIYIYLVSLKFQIFTKENETIIVCI